MSGISWAGGGEWGCAGKGLEGAPGSGAEPGACLECQWLQPLLQHLSSVPRTRISPALSLVLPSEEQFLILQSIFYPQYFYLLCVVFLIFQELFSPRFLHIYLCWGWELERLSDHDVSHKPGTEENSFFPLGKP